MSASSTKQTRRGWLSLAILVAAILVALLLGYHFCNIPGHTAATPSLSAKRAVSAAGGWPGPGEMKRAVGRALMLRPAGSGTGDGHSAP